MSFRVFRGRPLKAVNNGSGGVVDCVVGVEVLEGPEIFLNRCVKTCLKVRDPRK